MDNDEAAELAVVYQEIQTLAPYPRNARTHSKRQIRQIAESIRAFGFTNPVLTDSSRTIVAGHGRVEAAKLLGMTKVPTIRLESLSHDQIRAYIIADNRLAEKAGWDHSILAIELQHLVSVDLGFDVTLTGFDIPEIDLILQQGTSGEIEEEPFEIKAGPAVTKPGDLWLLGKHRILCGNALDESAFSLLMGGRSADVVFTDPPYNVKVDGHVCGNGAIHHREFAMASGEMTGAEFIDFLSKALGLVRLNSKDGSVHFICMDWRHAGELLMAGKRMYDTFLNLCVWAKDNGGMGSFYRSQHELVFVFRHGTEPHRNNIQLGKYGRNRTNLWRYPGVNTLSRSGDEGNLLALHPTVKPVAMIADAILDCSAPGDIVLDSFAGAGSTVMAAERVGRTCYAIEIDPVYVDTTLRRWEKQTARQAVHAESGKAFEASGWRMDEDRDYEVGYGRPPKASQFQKGRSGNPRGRPKRDPTIAALFRKITSQKVKTTGQNGPQYMTKLEASVTQLVNKAASGDLKAMRVLLQLATQFPELVEDPPGATNIVVTFVEPKPRSE